MQFKDFKIKLPNIVQTPEGTIDEWFNRYGHKLENQKI